MGAVVVVATLSVLTPELHQALRASLDPVPHDLLKILLVVATVAIESAPCFKLIKVLNSVRDFI